MKLSLIIEAVNKASRPLDRFRGDVHQAGRASTSAGAAIGSMDRHMERTERSARGLGLASVTMGDRIAAGARRGGLALVALERRMQLSHATMTKLAVAGAGFAGSAIRGGVTTGVAVGGALAAGGLYKIISAGMQAENFKTQLLGLESGNAALARKDMEWITKFAADTPFDLAQVTEAFITARNNGIMPMNGSLMTLGDSAAALGKTYEEAIGMLADAKTESFERMREFGITPSQKDGKVMLRYVDRLGKDMVKIVNKNGAEVERATLDILREKFGGGGAALAKTTLGKWNALTDRMGQQAVKVWEGGFGEEVRRQLDRVTRAFEDAEKDGSAGHWSKKTSEALQDVTRAVGEANWDGFRQDVKDLAGAFGELYTLASKASDKITALRKGLGDFERKAGSYSGVLGQLEYTLDGGLRYHAPDWTKPKAKPAPKSNGVPFFGAGESQQRSLPPRQSPPQRGAPPAKPAPTGKITVDIKPPKGWRVKPTEITAKGIDVVVNTGPIGGGLGFA